MDGKAVVGLKNGEKGSNANNPLLSRSLCPEADWEKDCPDDHKAAFAKERAADLEKALQKLEKHKKEVKFMALLFTIFGNMAFGFESVAHSNLYGACRDTTWFGYLQAIGVVFFNVCSILSSVLSGLSFLLLLWIYKKMVTDARVFSAWKVRTKIPKANETLDKEQLEKRREAPLSYLGFGIGCILASTWVIAFFVHDEAVHHHGFNDPCSGKFYETLSKIAFVPLKLSSFVAGITCFLASFVLAAILVIGFRNYYLRWKHEKAIKKAGQSEVSKV